MVKIQPIFFKGSNWLSWKKQLCLLGWSWGTTLWGSVPKVCLFSQHPSSSKLILIIFQLLFLLISFHDFGILKQLFISTLFPTKVPSGPARFVANIETAGNNNNYFNSFLNCNSSFNAIVSKIVYFETQGISFDIPGQDRDCQVLNV